ncbi:hypothetical protein [Piscinibacter defluvii]|uniref:hypothetical protein n=1 Tax=Piscinibacter defluvii TaxID=1796922 RepID=UPI000FDD9304|nr:hypothetical protein [Piscinibacter defluvii]
MNMIRQSFRHAVAIAGIVCFASTLPASSMAGVGQITFADLQGPWIATLNGLTGCGHSAMHVAISMNNAGSGTATLTTHGQCGTSVVSGQTFKILSMNTNGAGTAGLTCGVGCGWTLRFQVAPDRQIMNLIDVDPNNPGNFIAGVAVHY